MQHRVAPKINLSRVALPGTCGELVQGTLDGVPCLVSCPINRYSVAKIALRPQSGWTLPPHTPKAVTALRYGLAHLGNLEQGGQLQIISSLPRGYGYGSSTADIGATLYALGLAFNQPFTPAEVAQLAVAVEPSDSSLFSGLALFDHRRGSFEQLLGPAPPLAVIGLEPEDRVDTISFNAIDYRDALRQLAPYHREAFTMLCQGLNTRDWSAVGQAATLSAQTHQTILFNPLLDWVLALARGVGALGVCRAHSGTLLGLLLNPDRVDLTAVVDYVKRQVESRIVVRCFTMIDGGPQYSLKGGAL